MNDYNEKKYKVLNIDALYNIENKRLLDIYYAIGKDRLVLKFGRKRKYIIDNISIKSCCFLIVKNA